LHKRLSILLLLIFGIIPPAGRGTPILFGELQSNYYTYENIPSGERFIFSQYAGLKLSPANWRGWTVQSAVDIREGNEPLPGRDATRLITFYADGSIGGLKLRAGRFTPLRAGDGRGSTDGLEMHYGRPKIPHSAISLSGGREVYLLYRSETSSLPERYRGTISAEGLFRGSLRWQVDHTLRYLKNKRDDQVSRLSLRCRRFVRFGWDFKTAFDHIGGGLRDLTFGVNVKPASLTTVSARFSARKMRIYASTPLHKIEYPPTKIAVLNLRRQLECRALGVNLGFAQRLNADREVSRITLAVDNPNGEIGLRCQTGGGLGSLGGWVNAGGRIIPKLRWDAGVEFDRYDSAWDNEAVDNWANSLSLEWTTWRDAALIGRLERYRDEFAASDIRASLTFKVGFEI